MSNQSKEAEFRKAETEVLKTLNTITKKPKKPKEATNMKPIIETIKTVTIAVLITAIVFFIAGVKYQQSTQSNTDKQVKEAVAQIKVEQPSKK